MKMIQKLFKLFFLLSFSVTMHLYGSELLSSRDTLVYLPELAIVDTSILPLLDKAIDHEIKYLRRNNTFDIFLMKDNNQFEFIIGYLNLDDAKQYNSRRCGYFYYRENLFFVKKYDKIRMNKFFRKTKSKKSFYFNGQQDRLYHGSDETGWFYYYRKNKFVFRYLFDLRLDN